MEKKTALLSVILVGLVVISSGGSYLLGRNATAIKNQNSAIAGIEILTSKLTKSVNAIFVGQLTNVSGQDLTLKNKDSQETMTITLRDDAKISEMVFDSPESNPVRKERKIEDLKIGSEITIFVSLSPEGKIQGSGVDILVLPVEQSQELDSPIKGSE